MPGSNLSVLTNGLLHDISMAPDRVRGNIVRQSQTVLMRQCPGTVFSLQIAATAEKNTQLTACEAYLPESWCGGGGIGLYARGLAARIFPPKLVQNKQGCRPQVTGPTRKTLPAVNSSSLAPKARKTTDNN